MTEVTKEGLSPHSYLYRFGDPMSGVPVWRNSPDQWNGQRPSGFMAMYTADQVEAALTTASAEAEGLRGEVERLRAENAEKDATIRNLLNAVNAYKDALAQWEGDHD